jgi:hypothetical protein
VKNRTVINSPRSGNPGAYHLNEDQFVRTVADEKDLSGTERSHLSECPLCRAKKQEFEELLNNFTAMAKAFAPLPRKKIEITEPAGFLRYLRLQPLFAAGLLLMLLIGFWQIRIHQEESLAIIREMEKDEALMSEVIELEESPVPENLYPEIFAEPCGYFNDEFLEFVAPSEESRPVPRSAIPRNRLIYMSDGINSNR